MSVYASLCHDDTDPIDVAYSILGDFIRIWVKEDDDGNESTTFLTISEAEHVMDLLQQAIKASQR